MFRGSKQSVAFGTGVRRLTHLLPARRFAGCIERHDGSRDDGGGARRARSWRALPRRATGSASASSSRRCSPARRGRACGSGRCATSCRGTGSAAGRQAEVDAFMTAARARRQDVLVAFTAPLGLLRRPPLLPRSRLPRAERTRLPRGRARVRRRLPVGPHVLGLERGQPHLAADLRPPAARRPLLRGAAARGAPAPLPRRGRRRARHLEHARLPAGVPPPRAGPPAPVGAAQLPGRQPPDLSRHARDAAPRPRPRVADGDGRDREVRREPPVPLLGVARREPHALDVPAGRPLRRPATGPAVARSRGSTSTAGTESRPAPASTPGW